MGGIAAIAREAGHTVTGSDAQAWPPMSTQLEALGIKLMHGYEAAHLDPRPDIVVVGNVVSRGNAAMEHVLNEGIPYTSGPQWLAENVLQDRHVLAVAGTHGKTTTTSLLAWMPGSAVLKPGFLVGGVPANFGISARLGEGEFFVIEADEYDTAFFDKRSKFVHYRPRTAILNNLEYDHADIFPDLAAIERQFHHLVRTVPGRGRLVVNGQDANLDRVIRTGCWSEMVPFDHKSGWRAEDRPNAGNGAFEVYLRGESVGVTTTPMAGRHNRSNTLAAMAAAQHVGVAPSVAMKALRAFKGIKRRLERLGEVRGVTVIDDFAHHPTAVDVTIDALRGQKQYQRILAVLEPRSNTMKLGANKADLAAALGKADICFVYAPPSLDWDITDALEPIVNKLRVHYSHDSLAHAVAAEAKTGDAVLVMSNGDFGGVHRKVLAELSTTA